MSEKTRKAVFAGQFYEGDPEKLLSEIRRMMDAEPIPEPEEEPRALLVPHAGYVYSGPTAAKTFGMCRNRDYKRIFVISPSHRLPFEGIATASYSECATPLGNLSVDTVTVGRIEASGKGLIRCLDEAHMMEHALEVELPFLYYLFPRTPVVPLVCGQLDTDTASAAAEILKEHFLKDTLWVVSSDFTHFGASFGYTPFIKNIPEKLKELDGGAIEKILDIDPEGFSSYLSDTGATICGRNAILLLLLTMVFTGKEKLKGKLVEYTSSGQLTGDFSHCVSYAGITFLHV